MAEQDQLHALDDDVTALLAKAKAIPALDATAQATLLARVEAHLDLPPSGDGGAGGTDASPHAKTAAEALATKGTVAMVLSAAVGVVAGIAVDRAILAASSTRSPTPAVTTSRPLEAASLATAEPEGVPVSSLPSAPPAMPQPPSSASVRREPAPPEVSARGLGAERALLDVARTALARGEAQEALDAAGRHEREYPDGALVEEREALAIKSLVALGRHDAARKRATSFEQRFPNGLMLHAVKASVESAR